ncbi:MAG: dCTP deaminase domain-containing protein [Gammaproteobacteria bacterium]
MAFWSSQTLETRLRDLVHPFRAEAIDCNAYTLCIGPEIYVTPSLELTSPGTHTKAQVAEGEGFAIPAGQFAFLITEESVEVPTDAIAFISIRARTKFRGLVNVSGFHVDPGWKGRLIFAVFNAGPSTIHLQRGLPMFLIWYADLDQPSQRRKTVEGPSTIPPDMINNITGELNSFQNLARKMREADEELSDRIHAIENSQVRVLVIFSVISAILIGLIGYTLRPTIADWLTPGPAVHKVSAAPTKN